MKTFEFTYPEQDSLVTEAQAREGIDLVKRALELHTSQAMEWLASVAVKHQIPVTIGDYGSGQSVVLTPSRWNDTPVGAWLSSSANC